MRVEADVVDHSQMRARVSTFISSPSVRDGRKSEVPAVTTDGPRVFLGCSLLPSRRGGALRPGGVCPNRSVRPKTLNLTT